MSVRLANMPSQGELSALSILLSHRSTEYDHAQILAARLSTLGFSVEILPPGHLGPITDDEIVGELEEIVLATDICCVLASPESVASDWVRMELRQTSAISGRAVFVFDPEVGLPPSISFETPHSRTLGVQLQVKHSSASLSLSDDDLVLELCNDPAEGWFDGSEIFERAAHRDLKSESEIRKFIRRSLLIDPRYEGRVIVDVISFSWDESPIRDRDDVFRWVLDSRGRPDLRADLLPIPVGEAWSQDHAQLRASVTTALGSSMIRDVTKC